MAIHKLQCTISLRPGLRFRADLGNLEALYLCPLSTSIASGSMGAVSSVQKTADRVQIAKDDSNISVRSPIGQTPDPRSRSSKPQRNTSARLISLPPSPPLPPLQSHRWRHSQWLHPSRTQPLSLPGRVPHPVAHLLCWKDSRLGRPHRKEARRLGKCGRKGTLRCFIASCLCARQRIGNCYYFDLTERSTVARSLCYISSLTLRRCSDRFIPHLKSSIITPFTSDPHSVSRAEPGTHCGCADRLTHWGCNDQHRSVGLHVEMLCHRSYDARRNACACLLLVKTACESERKCCVGLSLLAGLKHFNCI